VLHKSFLVYYSEYFGNAIRGAWKEAEAKVIPLEDIEPGVFNVFANWLYSQELPHRDDWAAVADIEMETIFSYKVLMLMLKALVFGDRFMAPKFYRKINNQLTDELIRSHPSYNIVIYAFNNLPAEKQVLKVLVDTHCRFWSPAMDNNEEAALKVELPHEFLLKVMEAYAGGARKKKLNVCDYHEHENDAEKAQCTGKK
jgi:hypothetical protein